MCEFCEGEIDALTAEMDSAEKALGLSGHRAPLDVANAINALTAERDRLRAERDKYAEDLRLAAGDLPMALPQPGTDMARLMIANRLLKRERDEVRAEVGQLRAAQVAYASEFPSDHQDGPDVGRIHENVRALKDAYFLSQVAESEARAEAGRLREFIERIAHPDQRPDVITNWEVILEARKLLTTEHNVSR